MVFESDVDTNEVFYPTSENNNWSGYMSGASTLGKTALLAVVTLGALILDA